LDDVSVWFQALEIFAKIAIASRCFKDVPCRG
jgi:hypothetical protein